MSQLILLIALSWVDSSVAVSVEDEGNLSGGGVVCGTTTLPTRHILKFPGRNIYRFSDRAFFPPLEIARTATQPATYLEYFQMMRAAHNGDVYFTMEDGGGPRLVAISGRIADLGIVTLDAAAASELERPDEAWGRPLPDGTRNVSAPGSLHGVEQGHSYLIETTDGKFALFRIVEKQEKELRIEHLYQPDGSLIFRPQKVDAATTAPSTQPAGS